MRSIFFFKLKKHNDCYLILTWFLLFFFLQAKKEIYDIKQQRLCLAQDEYNHLNNALSTLNTSRSSREYLYINYIYLRVYTFNRAVVHPILILNCLPFNVYSLLELQQHKYKIRSRFAQV